MDTVYEFGLLLPHEVEAEWPVLRELLAPAIPHAGGDFQLDDILTEVLEGRWCVARLKENEETCLAVVAGVNVYPRKRVLFIYALGGRRFEVAAHEFWYLAARLAHLLRCSAVRGAVRPAMERYVKRVVPTAERVFAVMERSL